VKLFLCHKERHLNALGFVSFAFSFQFFTRYISFCFYTNPPLTRQNLHQHVFFGALVYLLFQFFSVVVFLGISFYLIFFAPLYMLIDT